MYIDTRDVIIADANLIYFRQQNELLIYYRKQKELHRYFRHQNGLHRYFRHQNKIHLNFFLEDYELLKRE